MLFTEDEILPRFIQHLSWAVEIDLATAWATSHEGLRALQRQRPSPEVRAIVGRWGNLTDPFALRTLAKIGQLRGPDASRHFHPKVFIFRGGSKSIAWVGSGNFTSGGFGMNDEAVFETTDTESVQDWFDDLWEHTDRSTPPPSMPMPNPERTILLRRHRGRGTRSTWNPCNCSKASQTGKAMSQLWSSAMAGGAIVIHGRSWVSRAVGVRPPRSCTTSSLNLTGTNSTNTTVFACSA